MLAARDCSGYDAWEWAQSVYESDPKAFANLDPDGDGIACMGLSSGFAPAFWKSELPKNVVLGTLEEIIDGDTYQITVNSRSDRYRLYRADTPEVFESPECGGSSATDYARYALTFSDTLGQVWVETVGQQDQYGRMLAYIWFTVGGEPYLLNHVLINNGWARDVDYDSAIDPYRVELRNAAGFAERHQLGVWKQCGGFGVAMPSAQTLSAQAPPPTEASFELEPTQAPMSLGGACDPNYSPCVPNVTDDLDCDDIQMAVQVIGYDRHGFDRDGDGYGCESYG